MIIGEKLVDEALLAWIRVSLTKLRLKSQLTKTLCM
jgi:hypothetical protein